MQIEVERALTQRDGDNVRRQEAVAADNGWHRRAALLLSLVEAELGRECQVAP